MWVVCVNFTVGVKFYVGGLCRFHSCEVLCGWSVSKFHSGGEVLCGWSVNFTVGVKCYVGGLCQFHSGGEVLCGWSVSISQWG